MSVELREYKEGGEEFKSYGVVAHNKFFPFGNVHDPEGTGKIMALIYEVDVLNNPGLYTGFQLNQTRRIDVESEHSYKFVSTEDDVDIVRIIREAPKNTPFILVESKTRDGKAHNWGLFVHVNILGNPSLEGRILAGEEINSDWGDKEVLKPGNTEDTTSLYSYRYVADEGKFPGYIKQEIEKLRRTINPKNVSTKVSYI